MRDEREFDEFYTGTCRRLVGQLYAMLGDLTEAEDAVQEAYCRAWQRRNKLSGYADPEAWVRTVAYRIAVSSWRKATRRLTAHRRHGVQNDVPATGPDHVALVEALRRISDEQRHVIVLHHLVGLSVDEISKEAGIPVGTVKSRLARGRRALAGLFTELADGESGVTERTVLEDV